MLQKGILYFLVIVCGSIVEAGTISVELTTKAVPISENGSAWGGGATFLAGSQAINCNDGTFGNSQEAYMYFEVSSLVDSITAEAGTTDWAITGVDLVLAETWYPHNASFYMGAGTFEVSLVDGIDFDNLTYEPSVTAESLGEFYHVWEDTTEAWNTRMCTPTSEYELSLTDSLEAALLSGDTLDLLLAPTSDTVGLAFFNVNWGGAPVIEIEYSAVPEPATIGLMLIGAAVIRKRKKGQ